MGNTAHGMGMSAEAAAAAGIDGAMGNGPASMSDLAKRLASLEEQRDRQAEEMSRLRGENEELRRKLLQKGETDDVKEEGVDL